MLRGLLLLLIMNCYNYYYYFGDLISVLTTKTWISMFFSYVLNIGGGCQVHIQFFLCSLLAECSLKSAFSQSILSYWPLPC